MSGDYMSHRVSIGIFYSRVYSIVRKKMFFMTKFKPFCYNLNLLFHASCNLVVHIVMNYLLKSFYTNLSFTMILLILILLDNDIAENPGPFSDEISIFHVNARSVRKKLDYIESVGFDSSLICITESHLDDKVLDDDIKLDGYYDKPFRKDRNCFGGGVLVYVSTTLKVKRRVDLEYDNHEFIWLQLDFSNKSVLICIVYRTQGAINPFWRDFQHSIEQSFNFTQHVVVTGDLNVDLLHEKNHVLNDIIQLYNLTNLVKEPTRIDIISGIETLLDPVLVSDDCDCRFVEVIDIDKTISDHKATKLYLKIPDVIHKSYQRLVWIYKKGDFVKLNNLISQFDWYKLLSNCTQNINMMCVRFTEKYLEFARECIPTKTITIRDRDKPWFNSGIKREMKIRDSLHKKMRKQPNINNICKYKVQRNKVNNMIIHAKQQFFLNSNDFLDENSSDPKLFWSLVKKLMGNVGRSCTMPPLLDTENDILYVDDIDKCNLLNSFFCSISNLDDNNCNPPNLELRTNSKLAIIEFTIKEISDILKSLNIKKSLRARFD